LFLSKQDGRAGRQQPQLPFRAPDQHRGARAAAGAGRRRAHARARADPGV